MAQNRRVFLQCLSAFCLEGALAPVVLCKTLRAQAVQEGQLERTLPGSWELES